MNYEEACEYLNELNRNGVKPGLLPIIELCDALGNPQDELKFVHIAGTNGKGSTGKFISNILRQADLRVGVYSSPAVFNDLEIISVNGRNISKADFAECVEEIKNTGLKFTRFELETAVAFLYFKKKEVDLVVLECGMGGELDATNLVKNTVVSVFTAIGMDHMQYLGDTLEEITLTKGGIIKDNSEVVVNGYNNELTINILCELSKEHNCNCVISSLEQIKKIKTTISGTSFIYKGIDYSIKLLGKNQTENAITAIETIYALRRQGFFISDKAIKNGLHNTEEPGRFEIISQKPYFVLDGAHNEPASARFRENVETYFSSKKIIFILSMLKDKECDKVIRNTCDLADHVITVTSPNKKRALDAFSLAKMVSEVNKTVTAADSYEEAVELSLLMSDKDTVIIAFGSLSHLSRVRKAVLDRDKILKDRHGL